jgi:hypothetical protein
MGSTDAQYLRNQQYYLKGFVPRIQDPIAHAQQQRGVSESSPVSQTLMQHTQAHLWASQSPENTAHFMAAQLGYWQETPLKNQQGEWTRRTAFHPSPQLMMQDPHYQDRWAQYVQTGVAPPIDAHWADQHLSPTVQTYQRHYGSGQIIAQPVSSLESAQQQGDAPATLVSASTPIVFHTHTTPQGPTVIPQSIAWHPKDPVFQAPGAPQTPAESAAAPSITPPGAAMAADPAARADDVRAPQARAAVDRLMYDPQADTQLNAPGTRLGIQTDAAQDRGTDHLDLTRRQLIQQRRARPFPQPYFMPRNPRND